MDEFLNSEESLPGSRRAMRLHGKRSLLDFPRKAAVYRMCSPLITEKIGSEINSQMGGGGDGLGKLSLESALSYTVVFYQVSVIRVLVVPGILEILKPFSCAINGRTAVVH